MIRSTTVNVDFEVGGIPLFSDLDVSLKTNVIALLQKNSEGANELHIHHLETKELITVIDLQHLPQGPRFSPDGRRLAFFGDRLYIHDLDTEITNVLFDQPDLHAGFCEWSPDGESLAFSAYGLGDGEKDKFPPNIYLLHIPTGQITQITRDTSEVDRFPHWSPCGRYIAFLRQRLDEPGTPGWIYLIDIASGHVLPLPKEPETSYTLGRNCFAADSAYILVTAYRPDQSFLRAIRLDDLSVVRDFREISTNGGGFWDPEHIACAGSEELQIISVQSGQRVDHLPLQAHAPVLATLRGPALTLHPETETAFFVGEDSCVYRWDLQKGCSRFEEYNSGEPPIEFAREEYRITSRDGRSIPVHRYIPPNPKQLGVLFVFGGPGSEVKPDDPVIQRLLRDGYEVISPSYRGSSGYGTEHFKANEGEYGRGDVWDVLESGSDWKRRTEFKRPLAIIGFSYGGFLTLLAMAQEETPWDCGVTLWATTRIEHQGLHLPRAYPKDPAEKARAVVERNTVEQSSRIRKPLLILHGGRDTTSTNEEVAAIRRNITSNGTVCNLVIFEDDTHGLTKNRKEMFRNIFDFLSDF